MKKTILAVAPSDYTPVAGDFELLDQQDIQTDKNFASQGYWKGVAIHFSRNRRAMVGLVIVVLMILLAIFGPMLSGYRYDEIVSALNAKGRKKAAVGISPRIPAIHELVTGSPYDDIYADKTFLFGTDDLGRDLWTRTWYGARVSLLIAFVTILIDMIIGMSYGLLSGYFGGRVDNVMQRFVEIANSIPRLVIVSVLAIFMKKGIGLVIVALLLTEWIGMSKIARAEMLKMKEQEYVLASRTLGASNTHIIFKEILPNTIGPIITQVMFSIPTAIFTEAFLSFIGIGISAPMASLGTLAQDAKMLMNVYPMQMVWPVLVICIVIFSLNFIGEGLETALNPRGKR
ncbi:MAG: ABC transporter permease [Clostridiales bacterium]|nr:ABC transporter permease [Clostridiales bacterium]MDY5515578.1 ABC transporter permease [Candidatus Ventricola sp.]